VNMRAKIRKESLMATGLIAFAFCSAHSLAQQVDSTRDINAATFSKAPEASSELVAAVLRYQVTNGKRVSNADVEDNRKHFKFLRVALGPQGEHDFIVPGDFPFSGADNDWFWIVRALPSGPRVVLWLHCLNFGFDKRRTNGLLGITNEWNSPNEEIDEKFRFHGQRYVRIAHRDKPFVSKQ
jgi:hypothetical protein